MALGKPAIVSRFGVLPERVTEDENGWVFPAGNVPALAQQLDDMADLPEEDYLKMCDKARMKAVEEYDVRAYAERILALDRYNENEV